jgi:hypothetical protein
LGAPAVAFPVQIVADPLAWTFAATARLGVLRAHTEQGERTGKQPAERAAPGVNSGEGARERVKAWAIHAGSSIVA